jgi:aryl-alcohol dehydrogenase-like predicted oxidoreductase
MVFSRSRRRFLRRCAAASSSLLVPSLCLGRIGTARPLKRVLGRTGIEVTTLGLGGQASIQRPPADLSPVSIIQKALAKGVNYIDTSNRYGPSQLRFGEAFREMHLIPGQSGYDGRRRRELFIASKSVIRYGKGSHPEVDCRTDGPDGSHTADDIRRSLSQMFGDGQGGYPQGAYLDFFFIHTLDTHLEVDAIYEGLAAPDAKAERIGALATLRDFRDGTNLTGLNPREERLIRHIGISGHSSSPVLMDCLQRDEDNLIDAMLVSVNANDRRYLNHQFNAIPVAAAKNVGIIGMKVFANGAMYTGEARWPARPTMWCAPWEAARCPAGHWSSTRWRLPVWPRRLSASGISTASRSIVRSNRICRPLRSHPNRSARAIESRSSEWPLTRRTARPTGSSCRSSRSARLEIPRSSQRSATARLWPSYRGKPRMRPSIRSSTTKSLATVVEWLRWRIARRPAGPPSRS